MDSGRYPVLSGAGALGHLNEIRKDLLGMLRRFNAECGDAGWMTFPGPKLLVLNSPALAEELLVEKAGAFRKSRLLKTALYPLLGDGLFTSEGELWRSQRRLMAPMFQPANIGRYGDCMTECAARCADAWADGAVVDIAHEATRITMSVAGRTLFDSDTIDEADELGAALTVALAWTARAASSLQVALQSELASSLDALAPRLPAMFRPAADKLVRTLDGPFMFPTAADREMAGAIRTLDERVARMIAERRAAPAGRDDLLSRLLAARDDESNRRMTDRQLRDEVVTLFVAGHETTATALAWAFYLLADAPEVAAQLDAEVAALEGRPPRAADLPRLALTTRVFKEALRLYPPVPVYERCAVEDTRVAGVDLARGEYVAVFPWALQHRAAEWPDPERFDPSRFEPAAEGARPRHAFLPFGAGPRVCIGNHFALMEGALVLATILQRARLERAEPGTKRVDPAAATLRPEGGIRMRVRRRAPVASRTDDTRAV